ncbi:hypothetical protein P153DRAFT_369644 [Dothidotthia symphoricarpi CBS 119687]|uniref:Uncharacterized protein n=1 Tax=Dothidotthia symphoricarpi CBS 119687 TaxID=1392245 RepID=A0A6A6A561_9PLEO|nr:uncharacterized protein P153DRAFT_369644 [Dothidotthia symphoricarpi CBS 119687]KAF2126313.1 hypothetical protein P153DRAFT_369644 [Dothidotthia symphoricarpi CBS 119687]
MPTATPSASTNPLTLHSLRAKVASPWTLGIAIGLLLYHIPPLVSEHMGQDMHFQNKVPAALTWAPDFVPTVDTYIASLRATDGHTEPINAVSLSRKHKAKRQKDTEYYTHIVEWAYKICISEALGDMFRIWERDGTEKTRLFNKGVDKVLSGVQWRVYPSENIVLMAGENDWKTWLGNRCEEVGRREVREGRSALEEFGEVWERDGEGRLRLRFGEWGL